MFTISALRRFLAVTAVAGSLAVGFGPQGSATEVPTEHELHQQLVEWAEANGMRGLSPASMTQS